VLQVAGASGTADIEAARQLFLEYAASLPVDLEYQGFTAELNTLPGAYQPPRGGLYLARIGGTAAGCVAFRPLADRVCEMKRLYVRPAHRSAGVGARLVEQAIEAARAIGYAEMYLDTLPSMTAAQRLYTSRGFREIPPYGGAGAPGTRYYGLRLVP
jgi:putative acetyltransferase